MKPIFICILSFFGLISCTQNNNTNAITDLTSAIDTSSGFVDLSLSIVNQKETDSNYIYSVEGLYKKDTVGLLISLKKEIKTATFSNNQIDDVFNKSGISFQSIGIKSDKLLNSMAELYSLQPLNNTMRTDIINLPFANLNQQSIVYSHGNYKFKVFMESDSSTSELFVDFDFDKKLIMLNEKDMSYREGIIKFLEKK